MSKVVPLAIAVTAAYFGLPAYVFIAASIVYGDVQKRSAARKLARAQRNAYNAGLTERTVSIVSADNPWQVIYGEATVGPAFVAILTSGSRDEFKHLVAVWAAHECASIEDVLLAGESVGALDSDGYVTTGKWARGSTVTANEPKTVASGAVTLDHTPARFISVTWVNGSPADGENPYLVLDDTMVTVSGTTVTLHAPYDTTLAGQPVTVNYEYGSANAMLRVRHHLGTDAQAADAALLAELPAEWTSSDRGRGLCYSVLTFNLNEPEFQSGPPSPTARIRGAKVYDPRLDSTQPGGSGAHRADDRSTWAWSANAELCTADFIRAEYGKRARASQLLWDSVVAAANVCDEALTVDGHTVARYTVNGAFRTSDEPDTTLDQLCQAMAGFATFTAGVWHTQAGAYTAPVMALTDADNAGAVEMVPSPASSELLNGLRGRFYDHNQFDQLTDYTPYQNAGFVAADGGEYWDDLDLPFTDAAWRAHNLARIQVERSRGMQLVYPAKMRAVRLKPGQRITLTCSVLGLVAVVFRVVKREYQVGGPVKLTLVFDDPSFYDEVDAPTPLLPPVVGTADPYLVAPVAGLAVVTGGSAVLRDGDGTVISRVLLTYTASTDVLVRSGGALQLEYRLDTDTEWLRAPDAPGTSTEARLFGTQQDRQYLVRARWRNSSGAVGDWRGAAVVAEGAATSPATATSVVVPGRYARSYLVTGSAGCVSGVRFKANGSIARRHTGVIVSTLYDDFSNWFGTVGGTPGAGYYIRFVTRSADGTSSDVPDAAGTVLALSSDRTVTLQVGFGDTVDAVVDYFISTDAAGLDVVATGVVELHSECA